VLVPRVMSGTKEGTRKPALSGHPRLPPQL
jgi:hypothetical protein